MYTYIYLTRETNERMKKCIEKKKIYQNETQTKRTKNSFYERENGETDKYRIKNKIESVQYSLCVYRSQKQLKIICETQFQTKDANKNTKEKRSFCQSDS